MPTKATPVPLADIIRPYSGLWVAVKNFEVVETAETAGLLSARLAEHKINDATIVRSPRPDEVGMVGLG